MGGVTPVLNVEKMKTNILRKIFNLFLKRRIDKYLDKKVIEILTQNFKHYHYSTLWDDAIVKGETRILKCLEKDLLFYCSIDSILDKMIFTSEFENEEIFFINSFLKQGDQFIDIGANSGLFTIYAAKRVGNKGRVFAFEPTDTTYKKLCDNIDLNRFSNTIAHQLAVSSKNEEIEFYSLSEGYDAWNSPAKPIINKTSKVLNVKAIQIDRMNEVGIIFNDSALVKIDVEGWELQVLKGGITCFNDEKSPTLMIEFADEHARNAGASCRELYSFLQSLGYNLYKFDKQKNELVEVPNEDYYYENIIAAKNIDSVNERLKMP